MCSATSISTTRASPALRSGSTVRASRTCTAPASPDAGDLQPGRTGARSARRACAARRTRQGRRALQGQGRRRRRSRRAHRRNRSPWSRCPTTIRTIRATALDPNRINRLTTGVYEMGSTFKAFTIAMALDSGKVTLTRPSTRATPLHYGKFNIHDFDAQHRAAHGAGDLHLFVEYRRGAHRARVRASKPTRRFCARWASSTRLRTELPESAEPIVPKHWGELNTMTIAFGHGLSVAPLAGGDGRRRADERRLSDPADLPQAQRGRGEAARARASSSPKPARRCAI